MGNGTTRQVEDDNDSEAKLAITLYWTCRMGNHHVAGNLVTRGASFNVLHPDSGEGALHAATEHGHFKVVQELLQRGADPNLRSAPPRGETALHCAVRVAHNPRGGQWTRSRALQCAKILLLDQRTRVDVRDFAGVSPVHLAAQFELWDFVEYFVTAGSNIDRSVENETARQLISRGCPTLLSHASVKMEQSVTTKSKMLNDLRNGREDKFIARLEREEAINQKTLQKFLQHASVYDYRKITAYLLERGADPNCSMEDSQMPPLILAARNGFPETLKILLSIPGTGEGLTDHALWRRTPLHHAVISASDVTAENDHGARCFVSCVALLLEHSRTRDIDVNAVDFLGNSAIQYAAKSNRRDIVKLLFQQHPAIFFLNHKQVPAFLHIHPKDLHKYFNSCISVKVTGNYERFPILVMDYSFMVPSSKKTRHPSESSGSPKPTLEAEEEHLSRRDPQPMALELEPLILLSRSPVHRLLLKHPIFTSFLHLKWQRVKFFFYINFILYFIFSVMLSLHIHFLITTQTIPVNNSTSTTNISSTYEDPYDFAACSPHNIIRWLAAFFLLWPLCREILEMFMSFKRYVKNVENLMETTLVAISIVLIFMEIGHNERKILSAVAILLTYIDLIFLIGRHPKFAIYITMFTRVSKNFLGFFVLFSFLIFAFAFSFFVIFHDCYHSLTCETKFFGNLGSSIFKTIIMLTGELETETMEFDVFSYIMFTGFVLFIAICLLNLLTGLAVSDIAAIREESEVDSCSAKVKLYSKIESILLGYSIEGVSADNWFIRRLRAVSSRVFAHKVRILGHVLPDYRLEIHLNTDNRMEPDVHTGRSWLNKMTPCLPKGKVAGSHHHEWDEMVAKAVAIATSKKPGMGGGWSAADQSVQIIDRLDSLEAKLTELLEALAKPKLDQFSEPPSSPPPVIDMDNNVLLLRRSTCASFRERFDSARESLP